MEIFYLVGYSKSVIHFGLFFTFLAKCAVCTSMIISGVGFIQGNFFFVEFFTLNHIEISGNFRLDVFSPGSDVGQSVLLPNVSIPAESFFLISNKKNLSEFFGAIVTEFPVTSLDLKNGNKLIQLVGPNSTVSIL